MFFLSSCKQLEYLYLIPFCEDLVARGNLPVDYKIGFASLKGQVLIFFFQYAGKPLYGRALADIQNLPLHTRKDPKQT